MLGSDAGFRVVAAEDVALSRTSQPSGALLEVHDVPLRAILFFEQQQPAIGALASGQAGSVQMHEREQRKSGRFCADGVSGQQRAEPQGFVAELGADGVGSADGEIPFVEQQVDDGEHAGQALAKRLERGLRCFVNAEAAQRLHSQHEARIAR